MRPISVIMVLALSVITVGASACSSSASSGDISKLIVPTDVKTGWYDAGVENGMNKLVPTIKLSLKNGSARPVSQVQLNAVIRRAGETEEWGGAYIRAIGSEGLAPGASTKQIVLRSNLGYTGVEPRNVMLKNHLFVDAKVQLFAKYGGANWVKLGEYNVARELMTD